MFEGCDSLEGKWSQEMTDEQIASFLMFVTDSVRITRFADFLPLHLLAYAVEVCEPLKKQHDVVRELIGLDLIRPHIWSDDYRGDVKGFMITNKGSKLLVPHIVMRDLEDG